MEWKQIVDKTTGYILSLPDRTTITMYEAIQAACPDVKLEDTIDVVFFNFLDEIVKAVEKTGLMVLDYSAHEDKEEGLPFNMDFIVRRKRLQKVQIISNLLCGGPCPEPEDAIEQRLTISATGRVWFTEYICGEIGSHAHPIGRSRRLFIGKKNALAILSLIADYVESKPKLICCKDVGDWLMIVTDTERKTKHLSCSMKCGVIANGVDLTAFIQSQIPIERMRIFI
jgi:hypothetical protein